VSASPSAAVVVVGSEILMDGRRDTNGPFIEEALAREGIASVLRLVVGDDREAIAAAIRVAAARAEIVIVSGGLGPTFDDLTREGAADAFNLRLARAAEIEAALRERFRRRGLTPPESVYRMADLLEGATLLRNRVGSAPGQILGGPPTLALVPGVPAEMEAMVTEDLLPRLRLLHPAVPSVRKVFKVAGLYESEVESLLAPVMERVTALDRTILASPGDVALILRAREHDRPLLERVGREIAITLGDALYSVSDEGIECVVARKLTAASLKLASAESCTGGMLGGLITSVPGSSVFYVGGVVAYSDAIKKNWLGVEDRTLALHGAVSAEAAIAMARGARERARADLALAITGVAGPGGGSPGKPVGLVHIALATASGETERRLDIPGERASIRLRSCRAALDLLRRDLLRAERGSPA